MLSAEELGGAMTRERVEAARRRPEHMKLLAGGDLFDAAIERMWWGIRSESPSVTEAEIVAEIKRRLNLSRRLERFG